MKLILAIVSNDDASSVVNKMMEAKFYVTKLSTTGGFLRAGNTTIISGVEDDRVQECIDLISSESCRRTEIVPSTTGFDIASFSAYPVEVQVGGATIFVMDVEQFVKV